MKYKVELVLWIWLMIASIRDPRDPSFRVECGICLFNMFYIEHSLCSVQAVLISLFTEF